MRHSSAPDNTTPISINDVAVTEGDSGFVNAVFTVSLSEPAAQNISVDFHTADYEARQPGDYTATSGTLTILAGSSLGTVTVPVRGDTVDEGFESFRVVLSNPTFASIADGIGIGRIHDDDPLPALDISDATLTEPNSTSNLSFTVTLTPASGRDVSVQYSTADGTGTSPDDYTATAGTLVIPAGATTRTIAVPIAADALDEANETFTMTLTAPTGATLADGGAIGTIVDDDAPPVITIADATVAEGDAGTTDAQFVVHLSGPSGQAVTATYETSGAPDAGTATEDVDYAATSGTLTIPAGAITRTINVPVIGDTVDETNETFRLTLDNVTNAVPPSGPVRNSDNGHYYELVSTPLTWDQARDAAAARTYLGVSGHLVTITSAAENSFLHASFLGHEAHTGGLQPPGSTEPAGGWTWITGEAWSYTDWGSGEPNNANGEDALLLRTDGHWNDITRASNVAYLVEYDVPLENPGPVLSATGTILDDEGPHLTIGDVTVTEGDAGTVNAVFVVTLSAAGATDISVDYATADGSGLAGARQPADYTATSGTLTIPAGFTTGTITVPVKGDLLDEPAETFMVNLSNNLEGFIEDGEGEGTIIDNDPLPALSINDVTVTEDNSGAANATFTVTLAPATGRVVTVDYATEDGTALAPPDYTATTGTLTIAAGTTTATLAVPVKGDLLDEANEQFIVRLSGPTNANLGDAVGTGTITDNDAPPTLTVSSPTVTERDDQNVMATFVVTLAPASGRTATVDYATADGAVNPALAGVDYVAASGVLSFAPGETSRTVSVTVKGDRRDEDNETFVLNLTNPVNASFATPTVVYNADNGHYYERVVQSLVWADAKTAAEARTYLGVAGHLATITSAAENSFLYGAFGGNLAHLGGYQPPGSPEPAGGWTWVTGEPWSYTNWGGVEPNNSGPDNTLEFRTDGKWNDQNQNPEPSYIVEYDTATGVPTNTIHGTATIVDNDPLPALSVSDAGSLSEGAPGRTRLARFVVSLLQPTGRNVSVNYTTAEAALGDTAVAGSDYVAASGTVTFAAGERSRAVLVTILGDNTDEPDEGFRLLLSGPVNAVLADAEGVATIADDDPPPALRISDATVVEGAAGTTTDAVLRVTIGRASAFPVSVNYATSDGSAQQPADYTAAGGTVTLEPGQTSKTLTVTVRGDGAPEGNEAFQVTLSSPHNATIADGVGIVTIRDDDAGGAATLTLSSASANTAAGTIVLRFTTALPATANQTDDYTVNVNGVPVPVERAVTSGAQLTLGLPAAILSPGDEVVVDSELTGVVELVAR